MPFYLKGSDVSARVVGLQSVLIVPCRFCPAASCAVRQNKPYIQPLRRLLRTASYESFIKDLTRRLRDQGIKTAVFDSKLLHQFVACMWTSSRRRRLAESAAEFDAVVVLGCDAMVELVHDAIESTECRVIQGMEIEGLMNVRPSIGFPLDLSLQLEGVTPMGQPKSDLAVGPGIGAGTS